MGRPRKELTQADKQAAYAYMYNFKKEKYDRFVCERPKGDKAPLTAIAKKRGMSMNEFINMCIDKELKRMKVELHPAQEVVPEGTESAFGTHGL